MRWAFFMGVPLTQNGKNVADIYGTTLAYPPLKTPLVGFPAVGSQSYRPPLVANYFFLENHNADN